MVENEVWGRKGVKMYEIIVEKNGGDDGKP